MVGVQAGQNSEGKMGCDMTDAGSMHLLQLVQVPVLVYRPIFLALGWAGLQVITLEHEMQRIATQQFNCFFFSPQPRIQGFMLRCMTSATHATHLPTEYHDPSDGIISQNYFGRRTRSEVMIRRYKGTQIPRFVELSLHRPRCKEKSISISLPVTQLPPRRSANHGNHWLWISLFTYLFPDT